MIEQILTDFRPARVLCAGNRAEECAAALRERGVEVHLLAALHEPVAPRFDLSLWIGVDRRTSAEAADGTLAALCQHSDNLLFSTLTAASDLPERDQRPASYWVTRFAQQSFYRDVDYDASFLGSGALCLRRLAGSPIPVVASYERLLCHRERELAAQRLVSLECDDTLRQRDVEIETLRNELALLALGHELMAVKARLAPAGTTRERYFNSAVGGIRRASRVARSGFALGEQLVREGKARLGGSRGV